MNDKDVSDDLNKKKRNPRRFIGYLALIVAIVMALNLCFEGFSVLAAPNLIPYKYGNTTYNLADYIEYSGQTGNIVDIWIDRWSPADPFIFNSNRDMYYDSNNVLKEQSVEVENQDSSKVDVHRRVLPGDKIRGRNVMVHNYSGTETIRLTAQMFYRVNGFEDTLGLNYSEQYDKSYNPIDALFGLNQVSLTRDEMIDNPGTPYPNVTDQEFYFKGYGEGDDTNPDGWVTRDNTESTTNLVGRDDVTEFCDMLKEKAILRIYVLDDYTTDQEGAVVYEGPAFPTTKNNYNEGYNKGYNTNWEIPSVGSLYNGQFEMFSIAPGGTVYYAFELELPGREMDGHGYSGNLDVLQDLNSEHGDKMLSEYYDEDDLNAETINFLQNEYMLNETTFWLKFGVDVATTEPTDKPSDEPTETPRPTSTSGGGGGGGASTPRPSSAVVIPSDTSPIGEPSPSSPVIDVSPDPSPFGVESPSPWRPELPIVTINPNYVPDFDPTKAIPKTGDWGNDTMRNVLIMGAMLLIALIALWRKKSNDDEDEEYEDDDDYYDDDEFLVDSD